MTELAIFEMARLSARDRFRRMLDDDTVDIMSMMLSPKVNGDTEDFAAQDVLYVIWRKREEQSHS